MPSGKPMLVSFSVFGIGSQAVPAPQATRLRYLLQVLERAAEPSTTGMQGATELTRVAGLSDCVRFVQSTSSATAARTNISSGCTRAECSQGHSFTRPRLGDVAQRSAA